MLDAAQIHYERSRAYLTDARQTSSTEDRTRFLASATENAVAIVEVFLSQTKDPEQIRQLASSTLPRYRLLKRVRIHEFHRRPVPAYPPELTSKVKVAYMQGPIKLSTGIMPNSAAVVTVGLQGLECRVSGTGSVDRKVGGSEKELCIMDGQLVDELAGDRIRLEQALEQYLANVPEFLTAVNTL